MAFFTSQRGLAALLVPLLIAIYLGPSFQQRLSVLGVFRRQYNPTKIQNAADLIVFDDTRHCEDLHHYDAANILFTACADKEDVRFGWFPAVGNFEDPVLGSQGTGSIQVIDPKTFQKRRLTFTGFNGAFNPHGIDVIADPAAKAASAVYIFVVNHIPTADYLQWKKGGGNSGSEPDVKSDSRVEIFHHKLGSSSARYVRTVQHELITTPNDVLAKSPTEFYVTNDHLYREGHLRMVEDLFPSATWSFTTKITLDGEKVHGEVALKGLHNNNGLGRGNTSEQILIGCASSALVHLAGFKADGGLEVYDTIQMESTIDNPSYFKDPYATKEVDLSGYVNAGLSDAYRLPQTYSDPQGKEGVMVWITRPTGQKGVGEWDHKLLFEDDGNRIRAASVAVLVAINPALEGGKRRGWLYVSGFLSKNMIAVKVDL